MQVEATRLDPAQAGEPQSLRDLRACLADAGCAAADADQTAIPRSAPGTRAALGLPNAVREVGPGGEHGGPA